MAFLWAKKNRHKMAVKESRKSLRNLTDIQGGEGY
jgi:hypothetical protein